MVQRVVLFGLLSFVTPLAAQSVHPTPAPKVDAVRLTGSINLDGRLDEPAWRTVPPATDFRQIQPQEGDPVTQRTEVRFVYDGEAIYVGARMYDSLGADGVETVKSRFVCRS